MLDRAVVAVFHQLQRQVRLDLLQVRTHVKQHPTIDCSGEKGQQSLPATCNEFIFREGIRSDDARSVSLSFCDADCSTKTRDCHAQACPSYSYQPSAWGACSATCGEDAVQTRTVRCESSLGDPVASSMCTTTEPSTAQLCGHGPCLEYECSIGQWSPCSISCSVRSDLICFKCART